MASQSSGGVLQFTRYFGPLLDALRKLGGSGTVQEVVDQIALDLKVPDSVLEEMLPSGSPRFQNRIQFARLYLSKEGLLSSSKRGVWELSASGAETSLTDEDAKKLFQKWSKTFLAERSKSASTKGDSAPVTTLEDSESQPSGVSHRESLLATLKAMPPDGFERFCQALLRESGFTEVTVTGRSGDGGIDGYGTLEVNRLVNFKVLFQCKRYKDSVSPDKIRDFRGAMQGRADKGLILTTGRFTTEAKREANRDGVPPIELIDGQKIINLCESLEFGLIPIKAFEFDENFFKKFSILSKPI